MILNYVIFAAEDFNYNSPSPSPMTILRQSPTDPKWFEDNVNDFSLSSFLGHLDACEGEKKSPNHEVCSKNILLLINLIQIWFLPFVPIRLRAVICQL